MSAQVVIAHWHPRTGAAATFPAVWLGKLRSGRCRVEMTVEGRRYVIVTDPTRVRGAA